MITLWKLRTQVDLTYIFLDDMSLMMTRPGIIVSGVYLSASFEGMLNIHRGKDVIFKSMDKVLRN